MSSDTNTRNMTLRLEVTIGQQVCHQPIGRRPTRQTLCTFVVTLTLDHSLSDISRFFVSKMSLLQIPHRLSPKNLEMFTGVISMSNAVQ